MKFHTGPATYAVVRKYDLRFEGDRVDGYIDQSEQHIYIDGLIEARDDVMKVLRHEQVHAWEWHAGGERLDEEDRAKFIAMCGQTFDRDWRNAGGWKAFIKLHVEGTMPPDHKLEPKAVRRVPPADLSAYENQRSCGMCQHILAAGSIATGDAVHLGGSRYVVDRYMRCPMCDAVTVWRETCSEYGIPSGGVIKARILTGPDAAAFLRENPAPHCDWTSA